MWLPPFWKISPQAFRFVSHQFYFFEMPAEEVVHTCKIFFIIKVYFPNLDCVGHENFFGKIRWALKFLSTIYILRWVTELIGQICDLPPAHPSSYFMTNPLFYHHRHRKQHHQHSAWYLGHQPCLPSWETRV